jgi:translation initiation factor IF-2
MQQRQLRLGDILDDYCPRERRVTNHAVVAMVGDDVKQTRCTTCDTEHEFKHAKVPRQRRKNEAPAALYAQVAASAPKRVTHESPASAESEAANTSDPEPSAPSDETPAEDGSPADDATIQASEPPAHDDSEERVDEEQDEEMGPDKDEGPIHRRLIRASLPRPEGQQPPARPIPEFTIRQPGGRPNRFRPRHPRSGPQGGQQFPGNRSNGNMAGARGPRPGGGRPGVMKRHGPPGRKRSK